MIEETKINPMIAWNPQDSDPKTAFWKTPGWAQCMGNADQNDLNFVGMIDEAVKEFARMGTFDYYVNLELYLKKLGFDPNVSWENKISKYHAQFMNSVLTRSKWEVEWKEKTSFEEIFAYLENRLICSFGISMPRKQKTIFQHYLNGVGRGEDANGRYILVTDSYGNLMKNYSDKNGYQLPYHETLIGKYITSGIFLKLK